MSQIKVLSRTQRIIVESPDSIRVVPAGPQGPKGNDGLDGEAGGLDESEVNALIETALDELPDPVIDHGELTGLDDPEDHPWAATTDALANEVDRATDVEDELANRLQDLEAAPPSHATSHVTGGSDVIPNAVSSGASGLFSGTDKAKLDAIESGATGDETAAELIAKILTVDGSGSELDADLLDGLNASAFLLASIKGSPLGVAELDASGFVPSSQLPSYVDDTIEAINFASLPVIGETGKVYVTLDDNKTFRWSGSVYVEISASLALGETSGTAYRGDRGKIAYDHSQDATTNPHSVTKTQVGLANVDNTSDTNKPVSTAQQTAIDGKVSDVAYDATSWNDVAGVAPSKNAVRDKFEAVITAYTALVAGAVSNTAFAGSWSGVTAVAPSKNAVYDKITAMISDVAYDATSWNGVVDVAPSKNAVRDQFEAVAEAYTALISDTAYAGSWDNVTGVAPSKNAVYDKIQTVIAGYVAGDAANQSSIDVINATLATTEIDKLQSQGSVLIDDFTLDALSPIPATGNNFGRLMWLRTTTGTAGTIVYGTSSATIFGALNFVVGTLNGAEAISLGSIIDGNHVFVMEWKLRFGQPAINGGGHEAAVYFGAHNKKDGTKPTSGCWFEYAASSIAPTHVICGTGAGGSPTETDAFTLGNAAITNLGLVDTNHHRFRITCDGAGNVRFYIDSVLVATHTTGLISTGTQVAPTLQVKKTLGTGTNRGVVIDDFGLYYELNRV